MTIQDLRGNPAYKHHHRASRRGYLSRRGGCVVEPYQGRFGEGYMVLVPRWDTSRYIYVDYYIRKGR